MKLKRANSQPTSSPTNSRDESLPAPQG